MLRTPLSARLPCSARSLPPHPPPKPNTADLANLLTDVATGRISVSEALAGLSDAADAVPQTDRVTLDLDRQRRCGFPEVIYGEGKPAEMIADIIQAQQNAGQASFATRIDRAVAEQVQTRIAGTRFNPIARTLSAGVSAASAPSPMASSTESGPAPIPHVAVVTAGSTDAPVAEEAIETLHWMGIGYRNFDDIGVAGPARLLEAVPSLREASAVIVIAGMEGALPAAVGGHLSVPVFAVPTSVGYGATLGGLTPMLGMLSCCASNVAVVNIDAGFKAAYLAGLVVKPQHSQPGRRP